MAKLSHKPRAEKLTNTTLREFWGREACVLPAEFRA